MDAKREFESTRKDFTEELNNRRNAWFDSGKDFTVRELDHLSEAVHMASDRLHERNDYLADFTDTVADQLHRASDYLKEENNERFMNTVDNFAHRHPGLTIGSLLVAGFATARYLKIGSNK